MIVKVKQRVAQARVINQDTEKMRTVNVNIGSKCSATVAAVVRNKLIELAENEIIFAVKELDSVINVFDCAISDDGMTITGTLVSNDDLADTDSAE